MYKVIQFDPEYYFYRLHFMTKNNNAKFANHVWLNISDVSYSTVLNNPNPMHKGYLCPDAF
jgi:hypothetical protein